MTAALRIAGITRVRNEGAILQSTLDHYGAICNAGIYLLDDASTDDTREIALAHSAVEHVYERDQWEPDPAARFRLEGFDRDFLFHVVRDADYVLCFDADERVTITKPIGNADAYWFRLWDYYITPDDVTGTWKNRRWIGPEYRDIQMLFRADDRVRFTDREPRIPHGWKVERGGDCEHYGKAMSVEDWDATCRYYRDHHPEPYSSKWKRRIGHAVHELSSFGNPLITWDDRHTGMKLTPEIESRDIYQ